MKIIFYYIILSIFFFINDINAQLVTISETHQQPVIGDTVHYIDANTFGFDPTGVGPVTAKVWDESGLLNAGTTHDFYYVDPAGIPVSLGSYLFPNATLAKGETGAAGYFYYQNTTNDINRLGWYLDTTNYGVYKNGTVANEFHFPITAGQNFSSTYNGIYAPFNVGEDSVNIESGSVSITADMQGMMILPTGAFNDVLRLHVVETFHIKPYLLGLPVIDEIISDDYYYWFADTILQPIILYGITTIDGTAQQPVLRYQPFIGTGISDFVRDIPMIFPNPSNGKFNLEINDISIPGLKIEILNVMGQEIQYSNLDSKTINEIDISEQPDGIYFIRVINEHRTITSKIVKQ